jgi:hypothetical protein
MALGKEPGSNTNWDSKESQCRTTVPVDQDIRAVDLCRVIVRDVKNDI